MLTLYNIWRSVPDNAKETIKGGRLAGMTDINPMWRIKALTEAFGPCGIGWKYDVARKWTEPTPSGEIAAFVDVLLYIKHNGEWSEAIPGTGGSMLVAFQKGSPYTNDDCFKMALTDALSVSCKGLGVGADVYWEEDSTKYDKKPTPTYQCVTCGSLFEPTTYKGKKLTAKDVYLNTEKRYGKAECKTCRDKAAQPANTVA